ncbi:hypothetical protein FBU30_003869 [Linnemannia zychae]|nr:hypothetical protein FBU30_003869 [Linnemannia zychae]
MLGPSSLRSQHPTKPIIKTYGGRHRRQQNNGNSSTQLSSQGWDKKTSDELGFGTDITPPTRQFNWDRLEKDRKARLERQAREQQRLAQSEDETAFLAHDVDLEALLYSDHEDMDEEIVQKMNNERVFQTSRNGASTMLKGEYVPSTQGSDDEDTWNLYSQTRTLSRPGPSFSVQQQQLPQQHLPVRTRGHKSIATTSAHVFDSDPEFEMPRRLNTTTTGTLSASRHLLTNRNSIGSSSRVSFSLPKTESANPNRLSIGQQRKVAFQEKPFFEHEEDEEENEDGDEVLFRTPSFDILKKLRELPPTKIPEPRANPFGFRPLSSTTDSKSSPSPLYKGESQSLFRGLESKTPSPIPLSTIDLFDNPFMSSESPTTKRTMEILRKREQQLKDIQTSNQVAAMKDSEECNKIEMDGADQISTKYNGVTKSSSELEQNPTHRRKRPPGSRETTPEQCNFDGEEFIDVALGKRISNIEITPQRLLAKQRRTISHETNSPIRSSRTQRHFISETAFDNVMEEPPTRPLKLFLDRDIPKDEFEDDIDDLFTRSRADRLSPTSTDTMSVSPDKRSTGSGPSRLLWPPSDHKGNYRSRRDEHEDDTSPFKVGSTKDTTQERQSTRPKTSYSRTDWLRSPSPQRNLRSSTAHSQDSAQFLPVRKTSPEQHLQQQVQQRPIRSLRRPQAVLVSNSKKSVFKPTVTDLLSICDQQFFEQFHNQKSVESLDADRTGKKRSKDIMDFEKVLPKSMTSSLTKIGEASYSEVYTVDLPIRQYEQRIKDTILQSPGQILDIFESSRLNTYVKESVEEYLYQQDKLAAGGGRSTKLVMKVLPFYDEQQDPPPAGISSPMKGSRRNKTRSKTVAPETESLALEDIYREVTVSTQIMQGWKGFIGSFGALVVRGKYPKAFLSAWDRFRKSNGTESYRPDYYTSSQLYCIILLPYGGIDLEHCSLKNWRQAWTVLTQVAASLESKEQAPFWFEHRDLHWGNILVKSTQQNQIAFPKRHLPQQPASKSSALFSSARSGDESQLSRSIPTYGIVVQMIDFTLARVQGDKGNLIYMDLEKDQDLFKGQGDYQFDIYRKMRRQIGKDWTVSCPRTNLFWLHYIADKLLSEKGLETPKPNPYSMPSKDALGLYTTNTNTTGTMTSTKRNPITSLLPSKSPTGPDPRSQDEQLEEWCYERVLAISEMNLDRLDPSGQTPSGMVLDQLFFEQPSWLL